jgi:hypothetical protein
MPRYHTTHHVFATQASVMASLARYHQRRERLEKPFWRLDNPWDAIANFWAETMPEEFIELYGVH